METDGFVLVKPSRKRRIKSKKNTVLSVNDDDDYCDRPLDLTSVIKQVSTEGEFYFLLVSGYWFYLQWEDSANLKLRFELKNLSNI